MLWLPHPPPLYCSLPGEKLVASVARTLKQPVAVPMWQEIKPPANSHMIEPSWNKVLHI